MSEEKKDEKKDKDAEEIRIQHYLDTDTIENRIALEERLTILREWHQMTLRQWRELLVKKHVAEVGGMKEFVEKLDQQLRLSYRERKAVVEEIRKLGAEIDDPAFPPPPQA